MRALLLGAFVLSAGCGLTADDGDMLRLLLYASPRVVPTDGRHIALVGVEASDSAGLGNIDTTAPMCVRLSAQLGSFDSPVNGAPIPMEADAGIATCPTASCTFVSLPTGKLRRDFAVYRSSTQSDHDLLLGELYLIGEMDPCPPARLPEAATSSFLTLDVGDVPPPAADLSVVVDLGGGDL